MIHATLLLIIGPQLDLVCLPYGAVTLRSTGNKMTAITIQNNTMEINVSEDSLNISQLLKKGNLQKEYIIEKSIYIFVYSIT